MLDCSRPGIPTCAKILSRVRCTLATYARSLDSSSTGAAYWKPMSSVLLALPLLVRDGSAAGMGRLLAIPRESL